MCALRIYIWIKSWNGINTWIFMSGGWDMYFHISLALLPLVMAIFLYLTCYHGCLCSSPAIHRNPDIGFCYTKNLGIYIFSCPDRVWDSSIPTPVTTDRQGGFTFWHTEWPQSLVTFETFDQSDEETWPDQKKAQRQRQIQTQRQWQRQIHLKNTVKEQP